MILPTICSFDLNQRKKTELYLAIRLDICQMGANPVIYAIHIWQICSYLDLNMRRLINVLKGLKQKKNLNLSLASSGSQPEREIHFLLLARVASRYPVINKYNIITFIL